MKKLHLVILLPLLVGLLYSCQKEQEPISSKIDQTQLEKSQQIIRQIEGFDTKLNSNLKSGETISVDSLVWYTEALENYNNARPDLQYENFKVSKTTYTATLDNGSLSMQDASALFSSMQTDLETDLANLDPTADKLKLTDVALDSIEGNTAYLSTNRVFGLGISALYETFEEDDDWIWGTLGQENHGNPPAGKCDGTMVGVSDGSDELMRRLNNPKVILDRPYRFIPTSLVTIEVIGTGDYADRLFFDAVDIDYCLDNDALTYYLEQSHQILNDPNENVRPLGKQLSHVQIIDDLVVGVTYYCHRYVATYGEITFVIAPID